MFNYIKNLFKRKSWEERFKTALRKGKDFEFVSKNPMPKNVEDKILKSFLSSGDKSIVINGKIHFK
jgi:RNA recognition motif-containing protein